MPISANRQPTNYMRRLRLGTLPCSCALRWKTCVSRATFVSSVALWHRWQCCLCRSALLVSTSACPRDGWENSPSRTQHSRGVRHCLHMALQQTGEPVRTCGCPGDKAECGTRCWLFQSHVLSPSNSTSWQPSFRLARGCRIDADTSSPVSIVMLDINLVALTHDMNADLSH
jgi:hypothetical protein